MKDLFCAVNYAVSVVTITLGADLAEVHHPVQTRPSSTRPVF